MGGYNEVLQQEHYYPFGMGIRGEWKFVQPQIGGVNQYLYNGKELNDDFGLDWNDYGARWYDAGIGRWGGVDPLAEDYEGWSGYNYVMGNPIRLVDPDGRRVDGHYIDQDGNYLGQDDNIYDKKVYVINRNDWNENASTEELQQSSVLLTEHTEGINISDNTWDNMVSKGAKREYPSISNQSDFTIFFKPEGTSGGLEDAGAYPLEANTDYYAGIDGIAAPHIKESTVYKSPDYNEITVTNTDVQVDFIVTDHIGVNLKSIAGWLLKAGEYNSPPAENWNNLFNESQP